MTVKREECNRQSGAVFRVFLCLFSSSALAIGFVLKRVSQWRNKVLIMFQIKIDRGMRLILGLLLITSLSLLLLTVSSSAFAQTRYIKQEFPRIGGTNIGSPPNGYEDSDYHKDIARLDLTILGIWEGWSRNGMDARDVVRAIKAINPNILLGNYTNVMEINTKSGGQDDKEAKAYSGEGPNNSNAHDWWARDFNGNFTSSFPNTYSVNITDYVKPDSNGDRYTRWAAKRDYEKYFFAPEWDIWMSDVVLWRPPNKTRSKIDFSGGTESDQDVINAAYRRGHRAHWQKIRELAPDIIIMPNIDWAESEDVLGRRDIPEYEAQVGAAILESMMGKSWSVETWGSWNKMMQWYRRTISYLVEPKIVKFGVSGNPSDYQFFRYGFASCLMDNGYFAFNQNTAGEYATVAWFDEYDLAGASNTSWLGRAVSPPQTSAWKNGVYRRDFENGVALVNPKGNGAKTVSLEPGLLAIAGTQDPVRNHGQPVSSITLQESDGIILIREDAVRVTKPKPPVLTLQ